MLTCSHEDYANLHGTMCLILVFFTDVADVCIYNSRSCKKLYLILVVVGWITFTLWSITWVEMMQLVYLIYSYSVGTGPFDHFQEQFNITVDSGRHEALTLTALLVLPECQGYSAQWWGTNSLTMMEDSEISIGSLELKETTEAMFWWRKKSKDVDPRNP